MTENPYKSPYNNPFQGAGYNDPMASTYGRKPHSGLGIASFIISLVSGFGFFVAIVVAGFSFGDNVENLADDDPVLILLGLSVLGCLALLLISCGLGIGALFQSNRNKLFGILGTVFSALGIVIIAGLMAIGMAVG